MIEAALNKLLDYCEHEQYKGYDPYDILNSCIKFRTFGKWGPPLAIQFQKLNPVNIRPLLGIKKSTNPKAMGLFLKAYCKLHEKTGRQEYITKAEEIFYWVKDNYSTGYAGYAWGYNFDWATPGSYLKAYTPSVVVTSFVIDGIFHYYQLTGNEEAALIIKSAADFISMDIPVIEGDQGISFMYTQHSKNACYNASLLAAEILAKADYIEKAKKHADRIEKAVKYVLSAQKDDGCWYYSYDPATGTERRQIDFHQGFILVSLNNILQLTKILEVQIGKSIIKGLRFYSQSQFNNKGRSYWRLPSKWPVDIHHQSQGIITFSHFGYLDKKYIEISNNIAQWTIKNMQHKKGYFYYRKYPLFSNKIPYMRWAQAWMLLALTEITLSTLENPTRSHNH